MRAKRILFGTEFGAGRGHHVRLRLLEEEVRKTWPDLECRFVLPPHSWSTFTAAQPDTVFPIELKAVRVHGPSVHRYLVHSICDLLLKDTANLPARLRLWETEFNTFKPDLVIADFAPSLSMAVWGKVPSLVIGNGYTLPPPESEKCLAHNSIVETPDAKSESEWLENINAVLQQHGAQSLHYLPQVNRGNSYGLFTIPLFDVYWQHRQQTYLGLDHPNGSPKPSQHSNGSALVYFSEAFENSRVIDGLIQSQIPITAYFGKLNAELRERARGSNVSFVEKPFNLVQDMPGYALTLHSGSLGMAGASLYAGIPQVGLYQHDEGMSNCRTFDIAQIGCSAWIKSVKPQQIAEMMHKAKDSASMRNFATALSHRYAAFRDENSVAKVVPIVKALIG